MNARASFRLPLRGAEHYNKIDPSANVRKTLDTTIEPGLGMGVEFKDVAQADRKQLELLGASLAEKYSTRTRYASGQF
jgi:hypothetical protein